MWQIRYDKSINEQLEKLPPVIQTEIKDGLQSQRWVHLPRRTGGSYMALPSLLPVRIGDYRILCRVSTTADIIDVTDIRYAPR